MSLDEALGRYAEAVQDLSSAGLAEAAGNHFNCADLCNQVAEEVLQAVYVLRNDSPAPYAHDLVALGQLAEAPQAVLDDLAVLTPYHPGAFLEEHSAEDADDAVGGDTAEDLLARARRVMRWARPIVLSDY
jgi:HEPN domain-containing protein